MLDSLKRLSDLATDLVAAQNEVRKLEGDLEKARAVVQHLEEVEIPGLLDDLGMESFKTSAGFSVEIRPEIHASISQANNEAALKWLEEHGEGGMVRRELIVGFNKDEEEYIRSLRADLEETNPTKILRTVHPSTLRAWVKRRLEEGEEVPNTISTHVVHRAVIK